MPLLYLGLHNFATAGRRCITSFCHAFARPRLTLVSRAISTLNNTRHTALFRGIALLLETLHCHLITMRYQLNEADYMTPPNEALLSRHVTKLRSAVLCPCAAVQRLRAAVLSPALLCRDPTLQISPHSALPLQPKHDWAKHCPYNDLHSLLDLGHTVDDAATRIRGDSIPCFAVPLCATFPRQSKLGRYVTIITKQRYANA